MEVRGWRMSPSLCEGSLRFLRSPSPGRSPKAATMCGPFAEAGCWLFGLFRLRLVCGTPLYLPLGRGGGEGGRPFTTKEAGLVFVLDW